MPHAGWVSRIELFRTVFALATVVDDVGVVQVLQLTTFNRTFELILHPCGTYALLLFRPLASICDLYAGE